MKLEEIASEKPRVIEGDVKLDEVTKIEGYANTIVMGYFDLTGSSQITSLEGCPIKIGKSFSCSFTKITSLKGGPRDIRKNFYATSTSELRDLKDIHRYVYRIGEELFISGGIASHILGVLKIHNIKSMNTSYVREPGLLAAMNIINAHLYMKPNPAQRNLHHAQEQLIESGLQEYAQL